jgi:predicted histidine transporter YuiF (NhaC family)
MEIVYMLRCEPGETPQLYKIFVPPVIMMNDSTKNEDGGVAI